MYKYILYYLIYLFNLFKYIHNKKSYSVFLHYFLNNYYIHRYVICVFLPSWMSVYHVYASRAQKVSDFLKLDKQMIVCFAGNQAQVF